MDDKASDTDKSLALMPAREQTVDFYGDPIPVGQTSDGELYVPLRPLTDFLGLDFSAQRQRVQRDRVLTSNIRTLIMAGADGRQREMVCLPLDMLPGWLFGINTTRVRTELVEKLDRYRAECFRVLWQAFKGDVQSAAPQPAGLSGAEMALEIATAVQHLARQQVEMETQLSRVAGRQEVMADYLRGFIHQTNQQLQQQNQRLTTIELRFSGSDEPTISEAEAAEIALAVKNVGQRLASQGDRNGYAKVYSEMYRRYGVSSYRNLSQSKHNEVLAWLHSWYQELDSNAEPNK